MTDRSDLTQQIAGILMEAATHPPSHENLQDGYWMYLARAVTDQFIDWLAEDRYARLKALSFQVASRGPKSPRCTKHLAEECDCP